MNKKTKLSHLTPEQRRARKNAQQLASYHRRMVDPAFREARAAKERQRWANGEGEHRNAVNRQKNAEFKAIRLDTARPVPPPAPAAETAPDRVAYKRAWRQAHAKQLNARRRADRQANPGKYHAWERDFKRRRQDALDGR